MTKIEEKQNTIAFDPGFGPYILVFSTTYNYMNAEVRKYKNANQRKMKYHALEPAIIKLCDNLISFYFGGMLYGAYLKNKYKDNPKILDGNDFLGANVEDCKNGDVVIEVSSLENFIKSNDKNPFASRKLNPRYTKIIDDYIEFLEINKYFTDVEKTTDIKLPQNYSYIDKFSNKQLDELYDTIMDSIKSKKIEKVLTSKYFTEML